MTTHEILIAIGLSEVDAHYWSVLIDDAGIINVAAMRIPNLCFTGEHDGKRGYVILHDDSQQLEFRPYRGQ